MVKGGRRWHHGITCTSVGWRAKSAKSIRAEIEVSRAARYLMRWHWHLPFPESYRRRTAPAPPPPPPVHRSC
ncbi:hypothetical protein FA13DRAFT_1734917 [Coprinellus micaceus]|uniref:Uncharacterized protein n=1 Tax=Coprinellus micaceus TaxID=71717 RepID=A0A4Y7T5M4_COPMI|nr:hypothetical protein FA13DRAFT_1734917 [Coprinellus micaceus]